MKIKNNIPQKYVPTETNTIYMAVTADKYELPVALENTARELSRKLGFEQNYVSVAMSKNIIATTLKSGIKVKFVKVHIDDDDDE